MLQVSETELKNRLSFDNPWWEDDGIPGHFRDWPRRFHFEPFLKLVTERSVRRAVVLMGPRRVGKTVLLTQAIQHLIDDGVAASDIFYVSVDTPTYTGRSLAELLRLFMEMHEHERRSGL
jgi:predicted AAA+ superfamily ATPase